MFGYPAEARDGLRGRVTRKYTTSVTVHGFVRPNESPYEYIGTHSRGNSSSKEWLLAFKFFCLHDVVKSGKTL